ncbi:glycosyltransferase family 4 protein [Flavobacterium agricola]|uniref:Glycosyltransferase family 4 protein n=1 Tax=Flavobacterium agricola TaxID=2870839 RepID=A0ABY6LX02_9FLAO|nr:glycosyltransferase family 4 protein [Flavobacterium agricola]UYW00497.1 glycosyltransferase family 4 protein [Flavobacterium agricola]
MKIVYIGNKLQAKGFTPTSVETLGNFLISEGYNVKRYSDIRNPFFRFLNMQFGIFFNNHVNCVIIDTYSSKAFWFAFFSSLSSIITNKKYILCLRGGNLPMRLNKNPKLCNWMFSNSFRNISPSGYLLQEFEKKGYKNLTLIPNTIEIENYSFLPRTLSSPKVLWVRSFAEIYNPLLAVDVLIELKKIYPEAELCMVGPEKDGSLIKVKQYAADNNVEVSFPGKLSKKEWFKLSENYNIFLNTTNFDNTPVSVMEAMALGLPVVSTNVSGLPFLIQTDKDGILVEPNNSSLMVQAIDKLVKDKSLYKKIQLNARKKAETWDWQVIKNDWNKLLEQLK